MGRMPWQAYLWPGLPQIWAIGSWPAVGVAVGFAAMVNLALAATVLWSELFTPGLRNGIWLAVAVIWTVSATISFQWVKQRANQQESPEEKDTFAHAMDHYLKGNWFEAEQSLSSLIRLNARDLDSGLMLATLLRHTKREDEAIAHLDRLERFEGCQKWELEIRRERELLDRALTESDEKPDEKPDEEPPDVLPNAARDAA